VLDEKRVLKRAARELVPEEVLSRPKQPYRAPDAVSFAAAPASDGWVAEALAPRSVEQAGVFDAQAVARLWGKCRTQAANGQFSNADNMALVGVLSTQLLHEQFVRYSMQPAPPVLFRTQVDRLQPATTVVP
jgi:asparagine synthase (glutamine-hydrolysing)